MNYIEKYKKYKDKYTNLLKKRQVLQYGGGEFNILDYNNSDERKLAITLMIKDILFYWILHIFTACIFYKNSKEQIEIMTNLIETENIDHEGGHSYIAFRTNSLLVFYNIENAINKNCEKNVSDIFTTIKNYIEIKNYNKYKLFIIIKPEYNEKDVLQMKQYLLEYATELKLDQYINNVLLKILIGNPEVKPDAIRNIPKGIGMNNVRSIQYIGTNGSTRIVDIEESYAQIITKFCKFYINNDPSKFIEAYKPDTSEQYWSRLKTYSELIKGYWRYFIYGGSEGLPYISVLLTDNREIGKKNYQEMRHINENILCSYVRYFGIHKLEVFGSVLLNYLRKYIHINGIRYKIIVHPVGHNQPWINKLQEYSDIITLVKGTYEIEYKQGYVPETEILQSVSHDGMLIQYIHPHLRSNKDIVLQAVEQNGLALQYANQNLQDDKDIVLQSVKQNGLALQYANPNLQDDKDIVLQAVKQNGLALQYANPNLQDDKDIVLQAVEQNGLALQYANPNLQDDKDIVLQAVEQNGLAVEYANQDLRANKDIAMKAVTQNYKAINLISKVFSNDKEVILRLFDQTKWAMEYASNELKKAIRDDRDFILKAVGHNPFEIRLASPELRSDLERSDLKIILAKKK
jgi:hypothetical protein